VRGFFCCRWRPHRKSARIACGQNVDTLTVLPPLLELVFDTCQSGGAVGLGRTARSPWQFKKAMKSLSRAQGLFVLGAPAAGEEAQEVDELGAGRAN